MIFYIKVSVFIVWYFIICFKNVYLSDRKKINKLVINFLPKNDGLSIKQQSIMLYIERKYTKNKNIYKNQQPSESSLIMLLQVNNTMAFVPLCAAGKTWKSFALTLRIFLRRCCMQFFSFFFSFLLLNNLRFTQNTWPHSQAA